MYELCCIYLIVIEITACLHFHTVNSSPADTHLILIISLTCSCVGLFLIGFIIVVCAIAWQKKRKKSKILGILFTL